jgi:pyruvate/2-oxoglutarate dehydrogenase complex dihydrolipoamide acyltransferase (E2) component
MKALEIEKLPDGEPSSIMPYMLWCIGQATKEHPEMHAIKKNNKLIIFEDVDISMMIEKTTNAENKMPVPYIFRGVQNKSYEEIRKELKEAKEKDFKELSKRRKKSKIYKMLPAFVRLFILKKILSDPFRGKNALGTIALTSLGKFVKNRKFWPIPISPYPCSIATGSIFSEESKGIEKKTLCLTIIVDHNIIDGGPAARFSQTLIDYLENFSKYENK